MEVIAFTRSNRLHRLHEIEIDFALGSVISLNKQNHSSNGCLVSSSHETFRLTIEVGCASRGIEIYPSIEWLGMTHDWLFIGT
jgi:hypothetical protein